MKKPINKNVPNWMILCFIVLFLAVGSLIVYCLTHIHLTK